MQRQGNIKDICRQQCSRIGAMHVVYVLRLYAFCLQKKYNYKAERLKDPQDWEG